MNFRLDKAVMPPTFVTSGRTYTLIVEDDELYILNTGRAKGEGAGVIGLGVHAIIDKEIKKGEERIDKGSIRELVKEKHCALLTKDQITAVNLKEARNEVTLDVHASKKKYHFLFPLEALPQVKELESLLTN
ncbi:MAG: hypothetical protein AB1649_27555 [Chloroflexota bacterium]